MKILLLGDQGQIGRGLKNQIIQTEYTLISFSRKDFDFTDYETLSTHISSFNPDVIINAAAYTKVDDSEENKIECYKMNAELPEFLAKYCSGKGIVLIHFSSDYVFSGVSIDPYKEDSEMEPINYYGYCKQQGDLNIIQNHDKYLILRTSWVYSEYEGNFLTKIIQSIHNKKNLKIVYDQTGVPTSSYFIAKVVLDIINNDETCYGIYNVVPDGNASWYEFGIYIYDKLKDNDINSIKISKISTDELDLTARRPSYSVLNNDKLRNISKIQIKDWRYYVDQLLQEDNHNR
tara:strand:+ start:36 stop:905 length:870 start_codon:yes stop_codon:yes gene_type:complete